MRGSGGGSSCPTPAEVPTGALSPHLCRDARDDFMAGGDLVDEVKQLEAMIKCALGCRGVEGAWGQQRVDGAWGSRGSPEVRCSCVCSRDTIGHFWDAGGPWEPLHACEPLRLGERRLAQASSSWGLSPGPCPAPVLVSCCSCCSVTLVMPWLCTSSLGIGGVGG